MSMVVVTVTYIIGYNVIQWLIPEVPVHIYQRAAFPNGEPLSGHCKVPVNVCYLFLQMSHYIHNSIFW
jgi:hypothetical protein